MNIFYLHESPQVAAGFHCDKHVVKMILESAQLLSTAHRVLDGKPEEGKKKGPWPRYLLADPQADQLLYSATHITHPCAIWVREAKPNYDWLYELMIALNSEFVRRYRKDEDHLTIRKLKELLKNAPRNIPDADFTNPPACMPAEFVVDDPVLAYRKYYNEAKTDIAKWTNTPIPNWFHGKK